MEWRFSRSQSGEPVSGAPHLCRYIHDHRVVMATIAVPACYHIFMRILILFMWFFVAFTAAPSITVENDVAFAIDRAGHTEPLSHDLLCGEGGLHGSCQWVGNAPSTVSIPSVGLADAAFVISPVRVAGLIFGPQPPHPRKLS